MTYLSKGMTIGFELDISGLEQLRLGILGGCEGLEACAEYRPSLSTKRDKAPEDMTSWRGSEITNRRKVKMNRERSIPSTVADVTHTSSDRVKAMQS